MICIFCFRQPGCEPYCKGNPGDGCTYGLAHEYDEPLAPKKQAPKIDKKLCIKCGLHPKNPASPTNGCAHEYAT